MISTFDNAIDHHARHPELFGTQKIEQHVIDGGLDRDEFPFENHGAAVETAARDHAVAGSADDEVGDRVAIGGPGRSNGYA